MSPFIIYGLRRPDSSEIRYVGRSSNGLKRPAEHAKSKTRFHVNSWSRSLEKEGISYIIEVLEDVGPRGTIVRTNDALNEAEIRWIAKLRLEGHRLTNMTDGGQGSLGFKPRLGRKNSLEMNEKIRLASSKRRLTQAEKDKVSRATSKPIVCLNDGREWPNARTASKFYGVGYSTISHILNGHVKRSRSGLHFRFVGS